MSFIDGPRQRTTSAVRAAFFATLTGVCAQRARREARARAGKHDDVVSGVRPRLLYKLLANALWDWHWLSKVSPSRFKFYGVGDLVWLPHFFGAVGQVAPKEKFPTIDLRYGLFADPGIFFAKSRVYQLFGFKGVIEKDEKRYLVFPDYIDDQLARKFDIQPYEERYWEVVVNAYLRASDMERDALSSCRTPDATLHSLVVQLLRWRDATRSWLRILGRSKDRTTIPIGSVNDAKAAVKQLFLKSGYWRDMPSYVDTLREYAAHDRLENDIPRIDERSSSAQSRLRVDRINAWSSAFAAAHDLLLESVEILERDYDPLIVDRSTEVIARIVPATPTDIVNPTSWYRWLQDHEFDKLVAASLSIIKALFDALEQKIDLRLSTPGDYYRALLTTDYPLPRRHFLSSV